MISAPPASAEVRIREMEKENQALRAELARLTPPRWPTPPGLSETQRTIFLTLMKAGKAGASRATLERAACGTTPCETYIKVMICRMRPTLTAAGWSVQTVYGWGYRMARRI